MVAAWAKDYCVIGWYVTDVSYRGRGIGSRLFDWSRKPMSDRVQILEADPAMDRMYMDLGFETFRSIQWISGLCEKEAVNFISLFFLFFFFLKIV